MSIDREQAGSGRVRTAPASVQQVRTGDNPWYEVILTEGRNRELRKMFQAIGHFVEKIRRVGYGPLVLDVEPGQFRELSDEEVTALRLTAEGKLKPRRPKSLAMVPKEAGRAAAGSRPGARPGATNRCTVRQGPQAERLPRFAPARCAGMPVRRLSGRSVGARSAESRLVNAEVSRIGALAGNAKAGNSSRVKAVNSSARVSSSARRIQAARRTGFRTARVQSGRPATR